MTAGRPDAPETELAEVHDAWLQVSDDLLAGVAHALNNRVAALAAVGQVLAATTEGPLSNALSAESARLQRTVQLLRLMVRRWSGEPEPIQMEDVLADAAELLSHHPDLRDTTIQVEIEPGMAPVLSERSSLTHALCLVLSAAARTAEQRGGEPVRVRGSGTPQEVLIDVELPAPGGGSPESDQPPGAAIDPQAARGLIQRAGGRLSTQMQGGELTGLQVHLPTLMEARRREREG